MIILQWPSPSRPVSLRPVDLPPSSSTSDIPVQYLGRPANISLLCYRIAETLPEEVLAKLYAPAKPDYPILAPNDIAEYDAFILGIPTRYGNFPAQWKVRYDFAFVNVPVIAHTRRFRPSGMLLAVSGPRVASLASTPPSSSPPVPSVVDRVSILADFLLGITTQFLTP